MFNLNYINMKREELEIRNQQIIEYVQTHSQKEAAEKFGLTQSGVGLILRKNGVKLKKSRLNMSKLDLNVDYFNKIDDKRKAYWIGFIAADGYVSKSKNKLTINVKDKEILEKFKKDICSEHKIVEVSRLDKRTNKVYTEYSLQIGNELFVENLCKWVNENKTDCFNVPDISDNYISYFFAGLFDGDGSIYFRTSGNKQVIHANLISTKEVLDYLQNILYNNWSFQKKKLIKVTENKNNVYKLYIDCSVIDFLKWIYQDSDKTIYLSRKYNLFYNNQDAVPTRNRNQRILKYSLDGVFIGDFSNLIEAAKSIGKTTNQNICSAYKRAGTSGGYYWIPKNDNSEIIKIIDINLWKTQKIVQEKSL